MNRILVLLIIILIIKIEVLEAQVSLKIDRKVFYHGEGGAYYSENRDAFFMAISLNQNADMLISSNSNDYGDNVKTGFIADTEIFFINEEGERDGKLYSIFSFIKKISDSQMISINTGFPAKDKELYYRVIINAVKSAELKS